MRARLSYPNKLVGSCVAVALALSAAAGCGSDSPDGDGQAGANAEAGQDGEAPGGEGGNSTGGSRSDGGRNSGGGRTGGGAGRATGGGTGAEEAGAGGGSGGGSGGRGGFGETEGEDGPGYDGVYLEREDHLSTLPEGCLGGFDPDSGAIEIVLDESVRAVLVSAANGILTINSFACESEAGEPAELDELSTVTISGGALNNTVYLDSGAGFGETLLSPQGGFQIDLGSGDDDELVVLGSDDADVIDVGSDEDADTILVDWTGDGVADATAYGIDTVVISTGPRADIIRLDGSALGLSPLTADASVFGGGANDQITDGAGDDTVEGGIGHDTFHAGSAINGSDEYVGGPGDDLLDYSGRTEAVTVTIGAGTNDGEASENDDVDATTEAIRGSRGPNDLTGDAGTNRLEGGPDNDILRGGPGVDFLSGFAGDDEIHGEEGDDMLYGDEGNDALYGGEGDDLLDGFTGTDVLDGGSSDADICVSTREDQLTGCEL